jgi:hypothetical protein
MVGGDIKVPESFQPMQDSLLLEKAAIKGERERLKKNYVRTWIEPARKLVESLKTLGKPETAADLRTLAELVRNIGTNHPISGKKVSFATDSPYDLLLQLRAFSANLAAGTTLAPCGAKGESTKWCTLLTLARTFFLENPSVDFEV